MEKPSQIIEKESTKGLRFTLISWPGSLIGPGGDRAFPFLVSYQTGGGQ